MIKRSSGDPSVMDTFEVPFPAAEHWVEEEAASGDSFTRYVTAHFPDAAVIQSHQSFHSGCSDRHECWVADEIF